MRTGAQFYTIKDYCKTLDGLSESLARVADIGYTTGMDGAGAEKKRSDLRADAYERSSDDRGARAGLPGS